MIRCQERPPALVQMQLLQFEGAVEVDVIEVKDRQYAGIGAGPVQLTAYIGSIKVRT